MVVFGSAGLDIQLPVPQLRAAEFFAGIGLIRDGLEAEGFEVVFSNDVDGTKKAVYEVNHGADEFVLADVRELTGNDIPDIELAVASFPCTDVSLAGARAGLNGRESGLVGEFLRIVEEMGPRQPSVIVLENVPGFATSNNGDDLRRTIANLNKLNYICDIIVLDALRFVPQSRPRIFIVGWLGKQTATQLYFASDAHPPWVPRFVEQNPQLALQPLDLPPLPTCSETLKDLVDRPTPSDSVWWGPERLEKFAASLSTVQAKRLENLVASPITRWATAYRRTRGGKAVWEIRGDEISGCLRTGRGGSSRQALVEAGEGLMRVRWMSAREYCRLQGAPELNVDCVTENQARFALGDAVCVPAVSWLARYCLIPLLSIPSMVTAAGRWNSLLTRE